MTYIIKKNIIGLKYLSWQCNTSLHNSISVASIDTQNTPCVHRSRGKNDTGQAHKIAHK